MKDSAYEAHSATQAEDCLGQLHRPCSKPEGKHNGNITTQAMGNFPIKELPRQELPLEVAQEYAFAVKNGEFLPDETATSIQFKVTIF